MLSGNLPAVIQLATMAVRRTYRYRLNFAFDLIAILFQILLLKTVWTAIYGASESVDGIDLASLVTYLALANLQIWLLYPALNNLVQERVRDGRIATDLARPVGLLTQLMAQQLGMTVSLGPFVVLSLPIVFALGGLQPPVSASALALYAVSLLFAYAIAVLLGLLLGLVAFWTLETSGAFAIYRFVNRFFAGALVPLWFFPPGLRFVADVLPFQAQAFVPISFYLGRITGAAAVHALVIQLVWVGALALLARIVWSSAVRKVVIQGG